MGGCVIHPSCRGIGKRARRRTKDDEPVSSVARKHANATRKKTSVGEHEDDGYDEEIEERSMGDDEDNLKCEEEGSVDEE